MLYFCLQCLCSSSLFCFWFLPLSFHYHCHLFHHCLISTLSHFRRLRLRLTLSVKCHIDNDEARALRTNHQSLNDVTKGRASRANHQSSNNIVEGWILRANNLSPINVAEVRILRANHLSPINFAKVWIQRANHQTPNNFVEGQI